MNIDQEMTVEQINAEVKKFVFDKGAVELFSNGAHEQLITIYINKIINAIQPFSIVTSPFVLAALQLCYKTLEPMYPEAVPGAKELVEGGLIISALKTNERDIT